MNKKDFSGIEINLFYWLQFGYIIIIIIPEKK